MMKYMHNMHCTYLSVVLCLKNFLIIIILKTKLYYYKFLHCKLVTTLVSRTDITNENAVFIYFFLIYFVYFPTFLFRFILPIVEGG